MNRAGADFRRVAYFAAMTPIGTVLLAAVAAVLLVVLGVEGAPFWFVVGGIAAFFLSLDVVVSWALRRERKTVWDFAGHLADQVARGQRNV